MRRIIALAVLAVVPMFAAALPVETQAPVAPAFDIAVDVHPSSRDAIQLLRRPTPSTYTCQASVTVPDTKRLYVNVTMVASPGTPETMVRKFGDGFQLKFTVTVASLASEARVVAEISRAGQILARQSSRILLGRGEGKVQPVN